MLNHIELQGYIGRDPELSYKVGKNGQYAHVSFTLGVGEDFGDGTDWFYCVLNGKRAEVIDKWFHKGSEILVSGRMKSYKPANDPQRTTWLVLVEDFHFTRNGNQSSSSSESFKPVTEKPNFSEPIQSTFDDLPDSFEEAEGDIPF